MLRIVPSSPLRPIPPLGSTFWPYSRLFGQKNTPARPLASILSPYSGSGTEEKPPYWVRPVAACSGILTARSMLPLFNSFWPSGLSHHRTSDSRVARLCGCLSKAECTLVRVQFSRSPHHVHEFPWRKLPHVHLPENRRAAVVFFSDPQVTLEWPNMQTPPTTVRWPPQW